MVGAGLPIWSTAEASTALGLSVCHLTQGSYQLCEAGASPFAW
jgi:hypothetical protein